MMRKKNNARRIRMGYLTFLFFSFALISYMGGMISLVNTGGRMEKLGKRITQLEAEVVTKEHRLYNNKQIISKDETKLEKIPTVYASLQKDTRIALATRENENIFHN